MASWTFIPSAISALGPRTGVFQHLERHADLGDFLTDGLVRLECPDPARRVDPRRGFSLLGEPALLAGQLSGFGAGRRNPLIKAFYERLIAAGKLPKVVLVECPAVRTP